MSKKLISFILSLAILLSLAACGGESNAVENTAKRDSLIIGMAQTPQTLIPDQSNSNTETYIWNMIYSKLVSYDENGTIYSDLATEWSVNSNMTEYTFTVRDDAKFNNGDPVTMDDIKFSIQKYSESPMRGVNFTGLSGMENEGNKLTVKFDVPNRDFLTTLQGVCIMNKAKYEELGADAYATAFISSGMYNMENYDETTGNYSVVRNKDYYGTPGKMERIEVKIIPEASTRLIALEKGEINWVTTSEANYDTVSANPDLDSKFEPLTTHFFFYMNCAAAPTDNINLRRAIVHAIDYEAVALAHAAKGNRVDTSIWYPQWGDMPEVSNAVKYDPELAKKYLEESGLETPLELGTFVVISSYQNAAAQIQSDLKKIGINFEIEGMDPPNWAGKFMSGDFNATIAPLGASGGLVLGMEGFRTGNPTNFSRYSGVDDLIDQMNATFDSAEELEYYKQIQEKLYDEAPLVGLFVPDGFAAFTKGLVPVTGGANQMQIMNWGNFYWEE